jgi:RNA polymerase sigma-70 factor (ECF subfamily)
MTELEKNLIDNIKSGDLKSFELVFKSYYPRLCKYANSWVHDYDSSADIVKDVFIKWWEKHTETDISSSVSAYLYKSVHNGCVNYIHRVLKNKVLVNESDLSQSLNELNNQFSSDYPLANLTAQELRTALEKSIGSLPDQCREIFILSRVEQKSHLEIASKLQISPNTVKVQIYRALIKLREDLKEYLTVLLIFFGV